MERYDHKIWGVQCRKEGLPPKDAAEALSPKALRVLNHMFKARGGSYARMAQGATYEARLASKLASCYVRWWNQ
jgi:hypothetical protein